MMKGRQITLYLREREANEVEAEAKRTGYSKAWLLRYAWEITRDQIRKIPTVPR